MLRSKQIREVQETLKTKAECVRIFQTLDQCCTMIEQAGFRVLWDGEEVYFYTADGVNLSAGDNREVSCPEWVRDLMKAVYGLSHWYVAANNIVDSLLE